MIMLTYDIGFINSDGIDDETELDIKKHEDVWEEKIELINLILSLKEEMDIKEITYIDYVGEEEEEE